MQEFWEKANVNSLQMPKSINLAVSEGKQTYLYHNVQILPSQSPMLPHDFAVNHF
jgi:hypothetical protein